MKKKFVLAQKPGARWPSEHRTDVSRGQVFIFGGVADWGQINDWVIDRTPNDDGSSLEQKWGFICSTNGKFSLSAGTESAGGGH